MALIKLFSARRNLGRLVLVLSALLVFLQYRLFLQHSNDPTSSDHDAMVIQALVNSITQKSQRQAGNPHPVCSNIPLGVTADSLWRKHLNDIYEASIHPRDVNRIHAKWTKSLLQLMAPSMLNRGIRATPGYTSLERIYDKLYQRMVNASAPKLKIFVFGGSIVEGIGCDRWGKELGVRRNKTSHVINEPRECAWPFRLEHFLKTLMPNLNIQVENFAVGGTNSAAATPFLDYWLSPVFEPDGADIIINSYSANDNLPPAFHATKNTTVDNFHTYRILLRNQDFIESSLSSRPCLEEPIVMYLDDYLGNQQESIVGEGSLEEAIQILTDVHSHVGYISAAQIVRRWVYANTTETVFSPKWKTDIGFPTVNVHFGMSFHVSIVWALAYGMLQTTLDFCDDSRNHQRPMGTASNDNRKDLISAQLKRLQDIAFQRPPEICVGPRDRIYWEPEELRQVSLSNISRVWSESVAQRRKRSEQAHCHSVRSPCIFAFLAAPLGTHQGAKSLQNFLQRHISPTTVNGGWEAENNLRQGGFQNKLGLVATRENAEVAFGFQNIRQSVRVITIHYLKSYGPRWKDARVKFSIDVFQGLKQSWTTDFMLEGFHDQNTSISYMRRLDLLKELSHTAPVGSSIRFRMNLISGRTFKINAMMLCSR
jgi:hypothetical protein